MENITKEEASKALMTLTKLNGSKKITQEEFDILVRCVANIIELQNFGEKPIKKERVKVDLGHLPDCNTCGDYEYCAFKYDECTGYIPGDTYVASQVIEMVPESKPVVIPTDKSDNPLDKFSF